MRVSIIGAGRNRNGIGEYIGKYFHSNGAEVTSVLGTTEKTSEGASIALRKYGIQSAPYTSFHRMLEKEKPDAVVIGSPSQTHFDYLAKCVELGLDIFCEKPFVWHETHQAVRTGADILEKAQGKGLTVAMNSQWPFALKDYEEISGRIEMKEENEFFMAMSPFSSGKEMIPDSLPHALSLLYASFGKGEVDALGFESHGEMLIRFNYLFSGGSCRVTVKLASQKTQPRSFQFGFNGRIVSRQIELKKYGIAFHYRTGQIEIIDPLELSVRDFIDAVRRKREPYIGPPHILNNMTLLNKIFDAWRSATQ